MRRHKKELLEPMKRTRNLTATLLSLITTAWLFSANTVQAEDVKIVGSSTVTHFAKVAAARLALNGFEIAIETTGTSGGFSIFCTSTDQALAPITLASRPIKSSETDICREHGIHNIDEHKLGLSGVVVARGKSSKKMSLSRKNLFLALAATTPRSESDCTLQPNPRTTWKDVDSDLPKQKILVFGPPLTSGTRASFIDLTLKAGAQEIPCLQRLKKEDPETFEKVVSTIRNDDAWVDAGENDGVIIAAVSRISTGVGVIGFPLFKTHEETLSAVAIDGIAPNENTIASREYPLSRLLYVYAKTDALPENATARTFIDEITSSTAIGAEGYLNSQGLISLEQKLNQ